jgi:aryl-alcohol dehydrogenase-like predicted oxidoreductase
MIALSQIIATAWPGEVKLSPCYSEVMKRQRSPRTKSLSRRELLRFLLSTGALAFGDISMAATSLLRRPIPRTGELLPLIGLGTWQTFDVGADESERAPLLEVMREFVRVGGSVVDSSPMYGRSESVVGQLAAKLALHPKLFLATKVWTSGRDAGVRQMEQSFQRLRTQRMDLMQIHNLLDWRTQLVTLRRWKEQGKIRYIGVTHYTESAYDELARVLLAEDLDFVQLNYSIAEREAEHRLLPLAAERRLAVLVNRPFAQAGLFSKVRGQSLPGWATELGCSSWAQFFLKFVISHPAVTCAIPGTSKAEHLVDNMQAGIAPLPDSGMRERMARFIVEL